MRSLSKAGLVGCLFILVGILGVSALFIFNKRQLDDKPVTVTSMENVLPLGQLQFAFEIDSLDPPHWPKYIQSLGYVVHYGDTFHRQFFTHCKDSIGTDGPSSTSSDVEGVCDKRIIRYSLQGNELRIVDGSSVIARFPLPSGINSVTYNENLPSEYHNVER